MPNFSSVALFVQKLIRWGNFTPPQLFNVCRKNPTGKGLRGLHNLLKHFLTTLKLTSSYPGLSLNLRETKASLNSFIKTDY